ncbi:spermidine/putrescine ABC transporter substrate-binding protein, partial [Streptomyces toxytricini]
MPAPTPSRRRVTRRAALRGLGAAGLLSALAGCGVPSAYVPEDRRAGADRSARERSLAFANWPMYIDTDAEDEERRPTLEAFTERTGIEVRYTEEINDNDEFFGKVGPALMNRQDTGHDLVVVSDWMAARFVRLGWAQAMD